jgi:hypothetical protein
MTSIPEDPFAEFDSEGQSANSILVYESGGVEAGIGTPQCRACLLMWVMWSKGPDQTQLISGSNPNHSQTTFNYAPTNGTKSTGSIYMWGGDARFVGIRIDNANVMSLVKTAPVSPLVVDNIPYVRKLPPNLR